jgi:hypothetical protein
MRMLLESMHPSFCSAILSIIFKGVILQKQFEATKWVSEAANQRMTDDAMTKRKKQKDRQLSTKDCTVEQQEPHTPKPWMNSGAK